MNGLDILAIIIFSLFVIVCAFSGALKIITKWGAFFLATVLSKLFGGRLGEWLLGDSLGDFAPIFGILICFVILYILLRIILGALAKLIKKALNANALDHILGAVVGAFGGLAVVFLLALLLEVVIVVVSVFNPNAEIVDTLSNLAEDSFVIEYVIRIVDYRGISLF